MYQIPLTYKNSQETVTDTAPYNAGAALNAFVCLSSLIALIVTSYSDEVSPIFFDQEPIQLLLVFGSWFGIVSAVMLKDIDSNLHKKDMDHKGNRVAALVMGTVSLVLLGSALVYCLGAVSGADGMLSAPYANPGPRNLGEGALFAAFCMGILVTMIVNFGLMLHHERQLKKFNGQGSDSVRSTPTLTSAYPSINGRELVNSADPFESDNPIFNPSQNQTIVHVV